MRSAVVAVVIALLATMMVACSEERSGWRPPPKLAVFDYQLGGAYDLPADVQVVVRDRTSPPAPDRYNVCYVNAFQTQPDGAGDYGTTSWWLANHPDLVLLGKGGEPVIDVEWNEALFDVSTEVRRTALLAVQKQWLEDCAEDGFDAVEADNLDSYSRSDGRFDVDANAAYAEVFIEYAHSRGLAVAQKNTPELADRRAEIGFDFAIAEECGRYDECSVYQSAYGEAVLDIEYDDYSESFFVSACDAYGDEISIIRRDRDLVPENDNGYLFQTC